jgi:hypothetical protein
MHISILIYQLIINSELDEFDVTARKTARLQTIITASTVFTAKLRKIEK